MRFSSLQLGMGTNMALPMWGFYMKRAYEDESLQLSYEDFEDPEGLDISSELECNSSIKDSTDAFESEGLFD